MGASRRLRGLDLPDVPDQGQRSKLRSTEVANETPAERKLALFHGEWKGDIDRVFREFAVERGMT